MYVYKTENLLIEDSDIKMNYSFEKGGGLYLRNVDRVKIIKSSFLDNLVHYRKNIPLFSKNNDYLIS